jgi:hypothetical protein
VRTAWRGSSSGSPSSGWCAAVVPRMSLDGWVLVRLKDVQAVSMDPDPECFEIKALKARNQWPPTAPELHLDDAVGVLTSTSATPAMVSVCDEFDRPDVCWIDAVVPKKLYGCRTGESYSRRS